MLSGCALYLVWVRVSVRVVLSAAHLDCAVVEFLDQATRRVLVERLRREDVVRPAPRRDVTPAAEPVTQRDLIARIHTTIHAHHTILYYVEVE